ncbi:MAG: glycosyltransferase family 2 protein [Anaerolineales bacterium]
MISKGDASINTSVIIPVYREAEIIKQLVEETHQVMRTIGDPYEIIVVDDGSEDRSAEFARQANANVFSHPHNLGNGAAIKTGIRNARGRILVTMDGDGQHSPQDISRLMKEMDRYEMVVGARRRGSSTSVHRATANAIYNLLATYVCGMKIEDLTSGFRAIKSEIARNFLYLLPNTFSYPTTLTMAVIRSGFSMRYIPILTAPRHGTSRSKIKLLEDGSRFLMIILRIATFFSPLKIFVPASLMLFLTGFGYGLFKVIVLGTRYGPTSAMMMTVAGLVFLVGLVSEQIAQLRFDRSEIYVSDYHESGQKDRSDGFI